MRTIPEAVEGKSLMPVVLGRQARVRDRLLGAYRDCQRMVRDGRWKLIQYRAGGASHAQLFDLRDDPDEIRNLADDPRFVDERTRLETMLAEARHEFGDPVDFDATRPTRSGPAPPAGAVRANEAIGVRGLAEEASAGGRGEAQGATQCQKR